MPVRRIGGEEEGSERIRQGKSFVGPFVYDFSYGGGRRVREDGGGWRSRLPRKLRQC